MTAEQVAEKWRSGFNPQDDYLADDELKAAIDIIGSGYFSHGDTQMFRPLLDNLLQQDSFLVLRLSQLYQLPGRSRPVLS
jgi:starch phosphorylase